MPEPQKQTDTPPRKRGTSHMPRLRERGPSFPQKKAPGFFEAISFMPHKGEYLRTRHETRAKAEKRLANNSRHTLHEIVDHTPKKEAK